MLAKLGIGVVKPHQEDMKDSLDIMRERKKSILTIIDASYADNFKPMYEVRTSAFYTIFVTDTSKDSSEVIPDSTTYKITPFTVSLHLVACLIKQACLIKSISEINILCTSPYWADTFPSMFGQKESKVRVFLTDIDMMRTLNHQHSNKTWTKYQCEKIQVSQPTSVGSLYDENIGDRFYRLIQNNAGDYMLTISNGPDQYNITRKGKHAFPKNAEEYSALQAWNEHMLEIGSPAFIFKIKVKEDLVSSSEDEKPQEIAMDAEIKSEYLWQKEYKRMNIPDEVKRVCDYLEKTSAGGPSDQACVIRLIKELKFNSIGVAKTDKKGLESALKKDKERESFLEVLKGKYGSILSIEVESGIITLYPAYRFLTNYDYVFDEKGFVLTIAQKSF
jgi:hypothetical protein